MTLVSPSDVFSGHGFTEARIARRSIFLGASRVAHIWRRSSDDVDGVLRFTAAFLSTRASPPARLDTFGAAVLTSRGARRGHEIPTLQQRENESAMSFRYHRDAGVPACTQLLCQ